MTAPPASLGLRHAWSGFNRSESQPIHGDLGPGNLIITAKGPCLLDWDEARVDMTFLDLGHVITLTAVQAKAHLALEIAACWQPEPQHARTLLHRLHGMA